MPGIASHPFADLFPLLEGEEFEALVEDIREHGLRNPIVLLGDAILDGRNRYRACLEAGVEPRLEEFRDSDPLAYIISHNLRRRHLDVSQRAMIAVRLATMRQGERTDLQPPPANLPKVRQAEAARLLNVGDRSLRSAKTVLDDGVPELAEAVVAGELVENNLTLAHGARETRVPAGRVFSFGPDHIHRLNGAVHGSISVHAYSPPLWRMGQYAVSDAGVLRRVSLSYADELRPIDDPEPNKKP